MGVDISHIVRHDFYDLDDMNKSRAFCEKTRDRLWTNLLLGSCVDEKGYGKINYLDDDTAFEMRIPYNDVEFDLRAGCWKIESYFHYVQLVLGDYVRRLIFDVVHALDQTEAWHAAEYYTSSALQPANTNLRLFTLAMTNTFRARPTS